MACDQENRHPRSRILNRSDDDRRREVIKLYNRSLGQKKAAGRLGVAKSTIQRYWPVVASTTGAAA
jgi:hypothetical protein